MLLVASIGIVGCDDDGVDGSYAGHFSGSYTADDTVPGGAPRLRVTNMEGYDRLIVDEVEGGGSRVTFLGCVFEHDAQGAMKPGQTCALEISNLGTTPLNELDGTLVQTPAGVTFTLSGKGPLENAPVAPRLSLEFSSE
jgi:hypothetical protein